MSPPSYQESRGLQLGANLLPTEDRQLRLSVVFAVVFIFPSIGALSRDPDEETLLRSTVSAFEVGGYYFGNLRKSRLAPVRMLFLLQTTSVCLCKVGDIEF